MNSLTSETSVLRSDSGVTPTAEKKGTRNIVRLFSFVSGLTYVRVSGTGLLRLVLFLNVGVSPGLMIPWLLSAQVMFYCHFPDKLLCVRRGSLLKRAYRWPLDL